MENANRNIETHPFEPFIPEKARVLLLGTFPPKADKWCMDFFYPNKINDMWRIMGVIFYDDKDWFIDVATGAFDCGKIKEFLVDERIAVYDTAYRVVREKGNASDKYLCIVEEVDVQALLAKSPTIGAVVATGEKAAMVVASQLGIDVPKVGQYGVKKLGDMDVKFYRMPSTSRAYPLPLSKKADAYRKMMREVGYNV